VCNTAIIGHDSEPDPSTNNLQNIIFPPKFFLRSLSHPTDMPTSESFELNYLKNTRWPV